MATAMLDGEARGATGASASRDMAFGDWLRGQLQAAGRTAAQFARFLGVPTGDIVGLLAGRRRPTAAECERIAGALGIPARTVKQRAGLAGRTAAAPPAPPATAAPAAATATASDEPAALPTPAAMPLTEAPATPAVPAPRASPAAGRRMARAAPAAAPLPVTRRPAAGGPHDGPRHDPVPEEGEAMAKADLRVIEGTGVMGEAAPAVVLDTSDTPAAAPGAPGPARPARPARRRQAPSATPQPAPTPSIAGRLRALADELDRDEAGRGALRAEVERLRAEKAALEAENASLRAQIARIRAVLS
jgi:transcriptional regulator with XRE-family HTH domain